MTIITRHGRPVAQLIPFQAEDANALEASLDRIARLRARLSSKGVNRRSLSGESDSLKDLTHDGHRY